MAVIAFAAKNRCHFTPIPSFAGRLVGNAIGHLGYAEDPGDANLGVQG